MEVFIFKLYFEISFCLARTEDENRFSIKNIVNNFIIEIARITG